MATTTRKKTARKKKTTRKKTTARKYSPAAGEYVREEMEEFESGRARSGRNGGKVTSRQQAIAIGLAEARRAGKKVPANPNARKKKS
jgi:hypothetical protein